MSRNGCFRGDQHVWRLSKCQCLSAIVSVIWLGALNYAGTYKEGDRTAIVKGWSWLQFLLVQAMMVSDLQPTRAADAKAKQQVCLCVHVRVCVCVGVCVCL